MSTAVPLPTGTTTAAHSTITAASSNSHRSSTTPTRQRNSLRFTLLSLSTPRSASLLVLILVNTALLRNLRTVHRTISIQHTDSSQVEAGMLLQHLVDGARRVVEEQVTDAQEAMKNSGIVLPDVWQSAVETISKLGITADDDDEKIPHKPLNILILYPDDMRHDSLGIAGTQPVQTPFLDSLARKGMRFTHNCVTTSICWISRANLFTGQYVSRHQARLLRTPIDPNKWNNTWPAILRNHGFYTGHIGKWQYWDSHLAQQRYNWAKLYEGKHWYGDEHVTDLNERDALYFLRDRRPRDRPFALQIAFYAPKAIGTGDMQWEPKNSSAHLYRNLTFQYPGNLDESFARLPSFHNKNPKAEARKRWNQRFGTPQKFDASMKAYYRMISEMDECSRNVVAELERQGILNETMIIFTTDNGFFHSEHGLSGKWFPYQESIRVPLIIWDPRMPKKVRGTTNDEFTLNIDLAETILGAAGLPPHSSMQGRDIADLYLPGHNKTPWRQEFYYEFPGQGSLNIIPAANAVVRKDFKLFHYPEYDVWQLFNLKDDPLEEFDLINDPKYADLVVELKARYEEMKASAI